MDNLIELVKGIVYLLGILSVLVIVHEWGHFIAARMCGMRVEDFSLFFGKVIWRLGVRNGTEYNIRAVPLGGFVKIAGMESNDISGGKPILEAIRGAGHSEQALADVIRQVEEDAVSDFNSSNITEDFRWKIHACIGPDGTLTDEGRENLEALTQSPKLNTDEHKLLAAVLDADRSANDPALYSQKPIWQRAFVIFAGPFMSLFFGYFLFCVMGMTIGLPSKSTGMTNQVVVIPMFDSEIGEEATPAHKAGLHTGDRVVAINGIATPDGKSMADEIHKHPGEKVSLTVDRAGKTLHFEVATKRVEYDATENGKKVKKVIGLIGVQPDLVTERAGIIQSIQAGTLDTLGYMRGLMASLARKPADNIGGPIAMVQMGKTLQRMGLAWMLRMSAMFSLSLGVMNLLPIPILDGGHLLLLGIEKVRRRKLSPREVQKAQMVGLALLALLVTFVMYNDIARTLAGRSIQ